MVEMLDELTFHYYWFRSKLNGMKSSCAGAVSGSRVDSYVPRQNP
ncbi:hypothetical protein B0G69_5377 [Paraburkholderia sp. RAU2J]|nr:hypothetical protein B0G69_5377 [Paraburkholderia sp. RAU2J]